MPLTRPLTVEEDITCSIGTAMAGIVAKYNQPGPHQTPANALLTSMFANCALGINEMIESSNMTITQKASLRGDMKTICNRAFRAPLGIVGADGSTIPGVAAESDESK